MLYTEIMIRLLLIFAFLLSACSTVFPRPVAQNVHDELVKNGVRTPLCEFPYDEEDRARVTALNDTLPVLLVELLQDKASYSHEEVVNFIKDGAYQASGQTVMIDLFENQNLILAKIAGGYCRIGSHDFAPSSLVIIDESGAWQEVARVGFVQSIDLAPDGWVVASTQSNLTYGPYRFEVWHVGGDGEKTVLAEYSIGSVQVDGEILTIQIETLLRAPPPCQFTPEVEESLYNIVYDNGQRVYRWQNGGYILESETKDVGIVVKISDDPDAAVPTGPLENWEQYCIEE